MKPSKFKYSRFVVLGVILLILLAFTVFQASARIPGLAPGSTTNSPAAISPGQQAAIDGASQLLLLQPQTGGKVYLPLVMH